MSAPTLYDVRDGVARITLDQPSRRNALSDELVASLREDLRRAIDDPAVRFIVLTGQGPAFCAGADLRSGGGNAVTSGENPFVAVLRMIREAPKACPFTRAITGFGA